MADENYSIIKPVEGMQNISGLTPAKRREERKRKDSQRKGKNKQNRQLEEENLNDTSEQNEDDGGSIDYRA